MKVEPYGQAHGTNLSVPIGAVSRLRAFTHGKYRGLLLVGIKISLLVILILGFFVSLHATEVKLEDVYYGNPSDYSSPASIELNKVLLSYRLYQELKQFSMNEPEYWLLLEKVNKNLMRTFEIISRDNGYDIIGEKGFIAGYQGEIPDITQLVLERLKNQNE
ncbi:MAG TPA: hypothetical protein EYP78_06455 [Candidatus Omnitrophica bacterium]|nr:hypothetical protein [Candidatus Omnitrophota bacterium]